MMQTIHRGKNNFIFIVIAILLFAIAQAANETPKIAESETAKIKDDNGKMDKSQKEVGIPLPPKQEVNNEHTALLEALKDKKAEESHSVKETNGRNGEDAVQVNKKENDSLKKQQTVKTEEKKVKDDTKATGTVKDHVDTFPHEEEYENIANMEVDVEESVRGGFYILLALSAAAVVFVILKIFRLRLSRAERRYGVHADRTTQELTPLPVAIEDINSDDEDHTVFEINRQQIRIL